MFNAKEYHHEWYLKNKVRQNKLCREYARKNRKRLLEYKRLYTKEHKEEKIKYDNFYRQANKERIKSRQSRFYAKLRNNIFEKYGNKCIKCGFLDWRALQVDHINGGGSKEYREKYKGNLNKYYKAVLADETSKYQLLCANCNVIKKRENNEN